MNSDMEKTLDEILSGVEALLEQAPAARAASRESSQTDHGLAGQPAAMATSPDPLAGSAMMRALLATLESDTMHPAHAAARRWLMEDLAGTTEPLGEVGGERFASVRVSAWVLPMLADVQRAGAVLLESDAWTLRWQWDGADRSTLKTHFRRFNAAVCLDQREEGLQFRIPRVPERLRCRFVTRRHAHPEEPQMRPARYACVDQDNSSSAFCTVLWLTAHPFVPDHVAGLVHHQGVWWPLIDASSD